MLLYHTVRSVLVPHDAQCWRRMAAIYGQTGQDAQAKQAHYTAWQLGIGQGGFGGPR
jgi:Flp pilus assembly protein TadD